MKEPDFQYTGFELNLAREKISSKQNERQGEIPYKRLIVVFIQKMFFFFGFNKRNMIVHSTYYLYVFCCYNDPLSMSKWKNELKLLVAQPFSVLFT